MKALETIRRENAAVKPTRKKKPTVTESTIANVATLVVFGVALARDRGWDFGPNAFRWKGSRGADETISVQYDGDATKPRDRWCVTHDVGDRDSDRSLATELAPEHYLYELGGYGATLDEAIEDLTTARVALVRRLIGGAL